MGEGLVRDLVRCGALLMIAASFGVSCASDGGDVRALDGGALPTLSPVPGGAGPACELPPRIDAPTWIPADLPFPTGTYVYEDLGERDGIRQAKLVVPVDQQTVAAFIEERWPAAGYELRDGDAEPGKEIDQEFGTADLEGAAKFQVVNCNPGYQELYLSIRAE